MIPTQPIVEGAGGQGASPLSNSTSRPCPSCLTLWEMQREWNVMAARTMTDTIRRGLANEQELAQLVLEVRKLRTMMENGWGA